MHRRKVLSWSDNQDLSKGDMLQKRSQMSVCYLFWSCCFW